MKISIVTPSFNQGKYIEDTIQSVLAQKGDFELEYIVMDGGSTDGTIEILRKYEGRIRWFSEKDKGQSDAVNKGFKLATGEIIGWINSDDLYELGAFQKVAHFFKNSPYKKWIYGRCRIIDENGKEIRRLITLYKNVLSWRYNYGVLLTENYISQMTVFFRKEIFDTVGYLDLNERMVMDYDYWLRIGKHYPAGVIRDYLADFRWHSKSKSGMDYRQQFFDEYNAAEKHAGGRRLALWLHKMNMWKIILSYDVMRLLRTLRRREDNG
jgi:glycosyltransferase involved in cell wall biosynthesis